MAKNSDSKLDQAARSLLVLRSDIGQLLHTTETIRKQFDALAKAHGIDHVTAAEV